MQFTLHFATINTVIMLFALEEEFLFTLHFATINTRNMEQRRIQYLNLHYTLLLLILKSRPLIFPIFPIYITLCYY